MIEEIWVSKAERRIKRRGFGQGGKECEAFFRPETEETSGVKWCFGNQFRIQVEGVCQCLGSIVDY